MNELTNEQIEALRTKEPTWCVYDQRQPLEKIILSGRSGMNRLEENFSCAPWDTNFSPPQVDQAMNLVEIDAGDLLREREKTVRRIRKIAAGIKLQECPGRIALIGVQSGALDGTLTQIIVPIAGTRLFLWNRRALSLFELCANEGMQIEPHAVFVFCRAA